MALTQISTQGIKNGTITGSDLATNIDLVDNQKIRFGTGNDLEIVHNSSENHFIVSKNTFFKGNIFWGVRNSLNQGVIEALTSTRVVDLYGGSTKVLSTSATGVTIRQGFHIENSEFNMTTNGTKILDFETGGTNSVIFRHNPSDSALSTFMKAIHGGAVELYHDADGSKKFETTSSGVTVDGVTQATQFKLLDNAKAVYGSSADMEIYHNGTNSLIQNGTGALQIITTTGDLFLRGQNAVTFNTAGNNERMRIDSTGRVMINTLTFSLSKSPMLEVRSDSNTGADFAAVFSANNQTSAIGISYNQIDSFNNNNTANLNLLTNGTPRMRIDSSGNVGIGTTSPAANLHLNGGTYAAPTGGIGSFTQFVISNQAAGQGAGISLLGAGNMVTFINFGDSDDENIGSIVYNNVVDSMQFYVNALERMNIDSSGNVNINKDNAKLQIGVHADLQLFHQNSNSYIANTNSTGHLLLASHQTRIINSGSTQDIAKFIENGACELYHTNTKRIFTESGGGAISGKSRFLGHGQGSGANSTEVHFNSDNSHIGIHFSGHGTIQNTYTAARMVINGTGGTYGTITYSLGGTGYNSQSSDSRSKKNIVEWTESELQKFKNLQPKLFHFDHNEDSDPKYKGYIAQDNLAAFPEAYPLVDDRYMFNPSGMVHYLMKAMQELVSKVEVLETEVAALKAS